MMQTSSHLAAILYKTFTGFDLVIKPYNQMVVMPPRMRTVILAFFTKKAGIHAKSS